MFSSLASYLFGSSTTTDTNPVETNTNSIVEDVVFNNKPEGESAGGVQKKKTKRDKKRNHHKAAKRENKENLSEVSEESDEDGWYFIEKEDGVEEVSRSESEEDLSIVELKNTQKPKFLRKKRTGKKRSPGKRTSPSKDFDAVTQSLYTVAEIPIHDDTDVSSANSSLVSCDTTLSIPANISMEESWFLTPPPIFTSTGPINMELSPFENLLIEHPSMSVYHSIRSAREATESFVNLDLGIEESQSNSANNEQGPPEAGSTTAIQRVIGNRVDRYINTKPTKETILFRKSQKAHEKREKQNMSRGAIKRNNNVCYILSKGSNRPRRADLQHCKVLSGSNNNRKC